MGSGIARCLAEAGADVFVNDLVPERAEAAADQVSGTAVPFDVTDSKAVTEAIDKIGASILVNNAGIPENMEMQLFADSSPEDWRAFIELNLYGVMNCSHAALKHMLKNSWGRIITISSGAGTIGLRSGVSTYAAGKGGAISFMRHLAMETARLGITANTLALGLMGKEADTEKDVEAQVSEEIGQLARQIPAGRLGLPNDVGWACVYLASPEASWMTGQTIQLNGGSVTT